VVRVLLTGMSGTGKSTMVAELAARGYWAVDLDCDDYSEWVAVADDEGTPGSPVEPGRDWVWREDRVRDLLASDDGELLFVSGCAANMGPLLPRFDRVVLLSAPADVIVERLAARAYGEYGRRPGEVARVLDNLETVEPLLRRAAGYEIDTSAPLEDVVAAVLELVPSDAADSG
jgi:broad-specificity NMP kinase